MFKSEHNPNLCLPLTFLQRQYHYMTSETMKTRQRKIKKKSRPITHEHSDRKRTSKPRFALSFMSIVINLLSNIITLKTASCFK